MPNLKVPSFPRVCRSKDECQHNSIACLLLVTMFLVFPACALAQSATNEASPVSVLAFKWFKDKRDAAQADASASTTPAPAMIAANRNFEKQRRVNDPAGVRDPNQDTLDGRSAELDRIVQEARDTKPPVDGYAYQARIQNQGDKTIKAIFWEYQFREKANPANVARHQFVCTTKVRPQKTKDLEIFTLAAPTGVVSVGSLANKTTKDFEDAVIINRVEFEDGATWQRKDWNFDEVKLTSQAPAGAKTGICRGL